jgi:hypothetical protein
VDAKRAQITRQETVMPVETGRGPKFIGVLKTFRAPTHLMFLFVTWWLGMGVGLVFSFLFWHLQVGVRHSANAHTYRTSAVVHCYSGSRPW